MPNAPPRTRKRRAIATLILAFCASALLAPAQTLSPDEVRLSSRPYQPRPILRSESRLVQLEVVVRDSHGRAVSGLTKDNFAVFDSGTKRDLAAFSVDTLTPPADTSTSSPSPAPETPAQPIAPTPKLLSQNPAIGRWIGLLFDDINTAPGDLAHTKIAASRFIKEAIGSGDRIAVFTTSSGMTSGFTNDSAAILAAMTKLQSHPHISPGGMTRCPRMTAYEAYQIIKGDPSAMKAKVLEACTCGGSAGCPALEMVPDSGFMNLTPTNPNGGYSVPTYVLDPIVAQAQQTWDQARVSSQVTLDAIKRSLDQLARMPGKRMLLLASSGFLSNTLDQEQDSIINEALRASVVINSLDAKGLYAEAPGTPLNETSESVELPVSTMVFEMRTLGDRLEELDSSMARFAESTGGLLFRNNNDLDLGFHQLGLLPTCMYLLGFTPSEDGKHHKIKVDLKNASHDFVQVRPGYFAPAKTSSDQSSPVDKMDVLMSGTNEENELPATLSEKLGTAKTGGPQLTILSHVDIQKLAFEQQKDRHVQKLTFVAALFDSQGNFVTGMQANMELALKPESFDHFSKTGVNGVMQLEVPPGTYRLRILVQESLHGTLSATTKILQIP
ncbi:MAG TPA: VWA domain-containing protein [Candidatus Acidoferrum sp.]|nr:VWA domain-containing protein [Candidatus Acidoferrum sp.]